MKQKMINYGKFSLQALWVAEMSCVVFWMFIICLSLSGFNSFEYYGYIQWPWYYAHKVVFLRFSITLLLISILCIGYSYRFVKTGILKALAIGAIPLLLFLI